VCPLGLGLNTRLKTEKEIELRTYYEIMNFVQSTDTDVDFSMETSSQCPGTSEHSK